MYKNKGKLMESKIGFYVQINQNNFNQIEKETLNYLESHSCTETTKRARREDWKHFTKWIEKESLSKILPIHWTIIERYLLHMITTYSLATVERRISTISGIHTRSEAEGIKLENPCIHPNIKRHLKNAKRANAIKGKLQKKAITYDVLSLMLATCDQSIHGIRDRALLLFAFASGGRRRSEVASAKIENLEKVSSGYRYFIPRSKTDQNGEGLFVPILGIAGEAVESWLSNSGISKGNIFRGIDRHGNIKKEAINSKTFARVIKEHLKKAGIDTSFYSAHSIRSGFVTEAANRGHNEATIMALTGHKSSSMVKRYYRAGDVLNNPAARICG
jgi:integrase